MNDKYIKDFEDFEDCEDAIDYEIFTIEQICSLETLKISNPFKICSNMINNKIKSLLHKEKACQVIVTSDHGIEKLYINGEQK